MQEPTGMGVVRASGDIRDDVGDLPTAACRGVDARAADVRRPGRRCNPSKSTVVRCSPRGRDADDMRVVQAGDSSASRLNRARNSGSADIWWGEGSSAPPGAGRRGCAPGTHLTHAADAQRSEDLKAGEDIAISQRHAGMLPRRSMSMGTNSREDPVVLQRWSRLSLLRVPRAGGTPPDHRTAAGAPAGAPMHALGVGRLGMLGEVHAAGFVLRAEPESHQPFDHCGQSVGHRECVPGDDHHGQGLVCPTVRGRRRTAALRPAGHDRGGENTDQQDAHHPADEVHADDVEESS